MECLVFLHLLRTYNKEMKKTFGRCGCLCRGSGVCCVPGRDAEGFETADLPADSLTVEGFSGYTSWMRQGDKVVVYTLPGDTNFSVYRLPEFEPLYDFAVEPRKPAVSFTRPGCSRTGCRTACCTCSACRSVSFRGCFWGRIRLGWRIVSPELRRWFMPMGSYWPIRWCW